MKELAETGNINQLIDKLFTAEQAAEAHRYVESGDKKGNVILTL